MVSVPAPSKSVLELTVRAVVIGLILSVVMGAANVYVGLKLGMTVSASIPAAVIGMLLLRKVFRNGSILEANQVQTAASAGESLAAGVIFTIPALVLLQIWTDFDMWMTTAIAFTGGLLGILFMIPMRRVFVIADNPELKFPEGVACAAVLEAGGKYRGQAWSVVRGALYGGLFKVLIDMVGIVKGGVATVFAGDSRFFYVSSDISPMLVAVGFIVRLNVAALIFLGGALSWLVILPLVAGTDALEVGAPLVDAAEGVARGTVRYVGVGAMVVGGVIAIFSVRHSLVEATRQLRRADRTEAGSVPETDRDLPGKVIAALAAMAVVLIGVIYYVFTGHIGITLVTTAIMVVMAFFFTAVASYIVGLVGNTNSPVSGMTITALLATGGLLLLFGFSGTEGILATLGVAAIVCCVACTSGDVCNDLKTGQIVGATPWKQQLMQVMGVLVAAFVMAPTLELLHTTTPGGIGGRELAAPQAALFMSLAQALFGDSQLPWDMLGLGAAIGFGLFFADLWLKARKSSFRLYVMPVAVGMYLPFGIAPPILIGGILAWLIGRRSRSEEETEVRGRRGVLFSSGIVAGEALTSVLLAVVATIAGSAGLGLEIPDIAVTIGTLVAVLGMLWIFKREVTPRREELGEHAGPQD